MAEIVSIKELLDKKLSIPVYQRPYRWHANKHVKQLLEDVNRELVKDTKDYRLGTIILYKTNKGDFEVVDGQQRLTTLSLILYALNIALNQTSNNSNSFFENQTFDHIDSRNNIKYNFNYISSYLDNINNKQEYSNFLLENCKVVLLIQENLSEAFQLFDSQNARGKSLAPSNLLKAFHLRSMKTINSLAKLEIVKDWEEEEELGFLNRVLGQYVFRIRKWSNKEGEYYFTKNKIDEFKGVNIEDSILNNQFYPFVKKAYHNSQQNEYDINETIVNGERFFKYTQHYIQLYKEIKFAIKEDKSISNLCTYHGFHRTGDQRLYNLFICFWMAYLDKFGKDKQFVAFGKSTFKWVFITRLNNNRISDNTILKLLKKENPLRLLRKWNYPDVASLNMIMPPIEQNKNDMVKGADQLLEKITGIR